MTLWTADCQAPLSKGFSRPEYRSGLPCPPPGDLSNPGIKLASLMSPALAGGLFPTDATWEAPIIIVFQFSVKLIRPRSFVEKAMTPHSSTLAWKIPWTEEPGRLQSIGL